MPLALRDDQGCPSSKLSKTGSKLGPLGGASMSKERMLTGPDNSILPWGVKRSVRGHFGSTPGVSGLDLRMRRAQINAAQKTEYGS